MNAERLDEIRRTVLHRRDGGWAHNTMIDLLDAVEELQSLLQQGEYCPIHGDKKGMDTNCLGCWPPAKVAS